MQGQQNIDNLPIDIHYNKLLDWLINRRHCHQQWQTSVLVVREKINDAIQDMPPVEEITKLLQGSYINYFHCLRIVELLKETEDGSKNIFGRYSSQRMKDWLEIVKLYEKDGVFLAEAAQMLMRNVNNEIPALKRQISKCKQIQQDTVRKESEYSSGEKEYSEKYSAACKQMDIKGNRIKTELLALLDDLPSEFTKITELAKNLQHGIEFYQAFIRFTLKNSDFSEQCLPLVRYMLLHGNTTTYQYHTGKKPARIEEPRLNMKIEDEETNEEEEEIDWGDSNLSGGHIGDAPTEDLGAIDFGDSELVAADIDWGDVDTDLDIKVEEGGITMETETESKTPPVELEEDVASGSEALTLLDNVEMRNKFLDELHELEAFFTRRVLEMSAEDDVISSTQFQSAPSELQVDLIDIQKMQAHVTDVLKLFDDVKLQHMLSIKSSPRYVDRLAENMSQLLAQSKKYAAMQRLMVLKRAEALEEQRQLEPKADLIKHKTLELKQKVEKEISKKYKDRPVNIMGEINTM